ncbi:MAG: thioredoxin family protein [Luteolibacter sp.]|uniref:thioredoxin family protein n=1 Tax=Luteolibacter sp. TaxID=1962973 RepID=UPI003267E07F
MTKAFHWFASLAIGVAALSAPAFAKAPDGWSTDLEKAFVQAKAENKPILLEFTGSTWCPQCVIMTKNVFSKKEFVDAAKKKFILVELDIPFGGVTKDETGEDVEDKNTKYVKQYSVNEFPHVILIKPDGKEFTRFFAVDYPKIDLFLKHLDEALVKKDLD